MPTLAPPSATRGEWSIQATLPDLHTPKALCFEGEIGLAFCDATPREERLNPSLHGRLRAARAVILRSASPYTDWRPTLARGGAVLATAWAPPNCVLVIGESYEHPAAPRPFMLRSTDMGTSWSELRTPRDALIGVRLSTPEQGHVWSRSTLYRTNDAGASWSVVAHWPDRFSPTSPPVFAAQGVIWIRDGANLFRRAPNGQETNESPPGAWVPRVMSAAAQGAVWVTALHGPGGPRTAGLLRRSGNGVWREVTRFEPFDCRAVLPERGRVSLLGAEMAERGATPFITTSLDDGATWAPAPAPIPQALGPFHVDQSGIVWAYGSAGRIERWTPPAS